MLHGAAWAARRDRASALVEDPQQRHLPDWREQRTRRRAELAEKTARRQAEFTALLPAIAAQVAADVSAAVEAALRTTRVGHHEGLIHAPTTTSAPTASVADDHDLNRAPATTTTVNASVTPPVSTVLGNDPDMATSYGSDLAARPPTTCSTNCPGHAAAMDSSGSGTLSMLLPLRKPEDSDTAGTHEDEHQLVRSCVDQPLAFVVVSDVADDHSIANKHEVAFPLKLLELPPLQTKGQNVSPLLPQVAEAMVSWGTSMNQCKAKISDMCSGLGYPTTNSLSVSLFQWDPGEQTRTSKNLLTSRVIILSVGVKELTEDSYGDSDNYKKTGYIRDANKDEVFLPLKLLVPLSKSKEPGMCPGLGCATTHSVCLLPWDPGEKPMVLRDSVLSRDIAWPACVKKMNADLSGSHDYDQKSGYADTQTYLHWLIQLSCSSANVIGKYFCLRLLIASIGAIHCFQVYWSHFKWALVIVSSLQTLGSYCLISDHYHCDPESMHWKILWFHSLLESGFQFWTAGKAHGYGAAKIQLDIAWPTTTLPYSTLYCMHLCFALECSVVICSWKIEIKSLGICSIFLLHLPSGLAGFIRHQLGAKPKFQWEIAWLLVWSYGARSDFLYMWLVTILSRLHFKLGVLPLVHFRDLSFWRSQSVDQMLKTGHVIHCGLELVQWKIAWLFNSEYSDVISQSKQLIPAATMTYHVLCSPWDPGIWALLCSYRFSAQDKATKGIKVEAPAYYHYHCLDHAYYLDKVCANVFRDQVHIGDDYCYAIFFEQGGLNLVKVFRDLGVVMKHRALWDPGGSSWHRLEVKPNFKEGRMLATFPIVTVGSTMGCLSWAWADRKALKALPLLCLG